MVYLLIMESALEQLPETQDYKRASEVLSNVYTLAYSGKDLRVMADKHSKMRDSLNDSMKKLLDDYAENLEGINRMTWFEVAPTAELGYSATLFMAAYMALREMGYFFKFTDFENSIYKALKDSGFEQPDPKDLQDLLELQPDQLWDAKTVEKEIPWIGWEKRREAEILTWPGVKKQAAKN